MQGHPVVRKSYLGRVAARQPIVELSERQGGTLPRRIAGQSL